MRWLPTCCVLVASTILLAPVALANVTPGDQPSTDPAAGHALPGGPSTEPGLGQIIAGRVLAAQKSIAPDEAADWQALEAFYARPGAEAVWIGDNGLNAKGLMLKAGLARAGDWGLEAADYALTEIPEEKPGEAALPSERRADLEMTVALTALKYARHARGGRITEPAKQLSSYLDRFPQYRDPLSVLEEFAEASEPGAVLDGLNPKHPEFERLRQRYLAMTREAAAADAVVRLPSGPKLSPGIRHPHVALLRKRLAAPAYGADDTLYDPALVEAVKTFQKEKGVRPDGIVGNATRSMLNDVEIPSPDRILANMEQWRWMPADLGKTYIWVNVPEFMFRVVTDGRIVHEERIIAGEVSKQTPVFSDSLETIYFHPRWNVPQSIKVNELYPSMARGGTSIQRQGLRMSYNGRDVNPASVNWGTADIRAYDVYQPPGPGNVLGQVKFTFPNKHGVYMHDTTSKSLFDAESRPFSHGCMRVRDPLKFAEVVLAADQGWDRSKIDRIIGGPLEEMPVKLSTPMPVHVTYFTVRIGEAGGESYHKDVYGHEQRIGLALAGKWTEIARGPDHLAPVKLVRVATEPDFGDPFSFFFGSYGSSGAQKPAAKVKHKKKQGGGSLADLFSGF